MERQLQSLKGSHRIIRLDHVFYAFSADIIGKICCESPPNFINDPDYGLHLYEPFIILIFLNDFIDSAIGTMHLIS